MTIIARTRASTQLLGRSSAKRASDMGEVEWTCVMAGSCSPPCSEQMSARRFPAHGLRIVSSLFLDMSGFLQELLLEGSDVIERGLRVLLAGNGEVVLFLALHQKLEEFRNMPGILLPFQARRPSAVPRTVGDILRVHIHRLDRTLTAGGS